MSWRVIVVSKKGKLDYKLNQLIIREGINETRLYLQEISLLIIENTATALTSYLLCELIKNKVRVIFCDHEKNPLSELEPFFGTNDAYFKLKNQIEWKEEVKGSVWQQIIKQKILNQAHVLKATKGECYNKLYEFSEEVEFYDSSCKEGVAAKVYFKDLFGNTFSRSNKDNNINISLNYGYSIILSTINREIAKLGYSNLLGIKHSNNNNKFNLGCDFIEPIRPLVDFHIYNLIQESKHFDSSFKKKIVCIFNYDVIVDSKQYPLLAGIREYVQSLFEALNNGTSDIKWINYEF